MIRARFALADPENVEATLSVTMPIKQWREVLARLSVDVPQDKDPESIWQFKRVIVELVKHAAQAFVKNEPTPEEKA